MTGLQGLGHPWGYVLRRVLFTALESLVSVSRKQDGAGSGWCQMNGKVCA
jgi:hypothetical protein